MIAGNIKPSISPTQTSLSGLAVLQLYNLVQSTEKRYLRNSSINLAINEYLMVEPE